MLMDIFSSFDEQNGNFFSFFFVIWVGSVFFLFFFVSLFWWSSTRWVSLLTVFFSYVWGQVARSFGLEVRGFASVVVCLFFFFLCMNLGGLVPYVFGVSSHLVLTFSFALVFWLSLILSSVCLNPGSFCAGFLPVGSPAPLSPFLVLIETVSVAVRPLTLGVRLAANMSAGHIVIGLIGSFLSVSLCGGGIVGIATLFFVESFYFIFEVGVCLVQAYIFVLLLTLYADEHSRL